MHSPEFELVAACCAWPREARELERIAACVDAGPDWTRVGRIARRQRVSALVHHALRQTLPADVADPGLEELARDASATLREGLLLAGESVRLLKLLREAGIEPVFLKGSALSMLAFGNVALRHARDIDLLVAPPEMATAEAVLLAEGYALSPNQGLSGNTLEERMQLHKDFEYTHPGRRVRVELHWRTFIYEHLSDGVPVGGRQRVAVAGSMELPTLADEELLFYLCVHGAVHAWNRLKWIADVNALLGRRPEGFDAAGATLLRQARRSGMAQPVEQALLLTRKLFGRPAKPPRVGWRAHLLSAVALQSMTAGDAVAEPQETAENTLTSLSPLLLRPRLRYIAEVAHYLIYVPHKTMAAPPASLPRFAYPFWRLYRWAESKLPMRAGR